MCASVVSTKLRRGEYDKIKRCTPIGFDKCIQIEFIYIYEVMEICNVYASDIFQPLRYGQKIRGYIKTIRDDGKIDVTLRKLGKEGVGGYVKKHEGIASSRKPPLAGAKNQVAVFGFVLHSPTLESCFLERCRIPGQFTKGSV